VRVEFTRVMYQSLDNAPSLICPTCGHAMRLVRAIPRLAALPELFVFSCPSCNHVETREAKRVSIEASVSSPSSKASLREARAY
jgi:hypothetical protein